MRGTQLFGIFLLTITTAFSQRLSAPLLAWLKTEQLLTGALAEILVPVVVAAFMIGVATVVLKLHDVLFGAWRWYRRRWDDLAKLEGHWVQQTTIPERPFSYARIFFDRSRARYVYEGLGFDRAGAKKAVWDSDVFVRGSDGREILFSALAYLIDASAEMTTDRVRVFGWLRPTGSSFFRGEAYDTGRSGARPDQFSIEARRIPPRAIRRYLDGRRSPDTDDQRREVARRYLADDRPAPAAAP